MGFFSVSKIIDLIIVYTVQRGTASSCSCPMKTMHLEVGEFPQHIKEHFNPSVHLEKIKMIEIGDTGDTVTQGDMIFHSV